MNKKALFVLAIISILAMTFASAAAPAKTATYQGAQFIQGKGLVLTFNVSGKFSAGELKGSIYVYGEKSYQMNCYFKDNTDNTVLGCVAPDKLKMFAGKGAVARFGDFGFYITIPSTGYYCNGTEVLYAIGRVTLADGTVVDWRYPYSYPDFGNGPDVAGRMKAFDIAYYQSLGLQVVDWDFIFEGCKETLSPPTP
ncbi:MAG: hypothetical protein AB1846_14790 [Chloroflexota bacterium]